MTEITATILQSLSSQLSHSLEKLRRVFSWCSSILICITPAILTAATIGEKPLLHFPADHILVGLVIIIATVYV